MGVWIDHADEHGEGRQPIGERASIAVQRLQVRITIECCHGGNGSGCTRWTHPCIVVIVHPIERLRYVARAGAAPDKILVAESVPAFSAFADDPRAMLVALRQLITRQPDSPGLLGLAAHMVQSLDPVDAGWVFANELEFDPTSEIAASLAIAESGGTDVIDSIASGPGEVLCPAGTTAWIEHAKSLGRSVAIVTPYGSRLPNLLWRSYLERNGLAALSAHAEPEPMSVERLPLDRFDDLIGPDGVAPVTSWKSDCPDVAEVARL